MTVYDKHKRGSLIAWGSDHVVFEYDSDHVVKFSILEFLLGSHGAIKTKHDYELCRKYFGDYVLPTEFLTNSQGRYVAKIQPRLSGTVLKKADVRDEKIRDQFRDIVRAYHTLVQEERIEVDLLGGHGLVFMTLSNIFVTTDRTLRIIDTTLLEIKSYSLLKPGIYILRLILRARQESLMKAFMAQR